MKKNNQQNKKEVIFCSRKFCNKERNPQIIYVLPQNKPCYRWQRRQLSLSSGGASEAPGKGPDPQSLQVFFVTCPSAPCSNISVLSEPTLALHFSSQYLLPLCCYCDPFGMTFELTIWYLVFWNVHSLTYKSSLKGRNPTTFLSDSMKEKLPFWQAPLNSPRVRYESNSACN